MRNWFCDLPRARLVRARVRYPDPAGSLRHLRSEGGLARSVRGIEVLTYERAKQLLAHLDVAATMRDYYLSEGATPLVLNFIDNGLLAWIEGDRHRRIRAVLERAFSVRSVDKQRETMREVANRMADRSPRRRHGRLLHRRLHLLVSHGGAGPSSSASAVRRRAAVHRSERGDERAGRGAPGAGASPARSRHPGADQLCQRAASRNGQRSRGTIWSARCSKAGEQLGALSREELDREHHERADGRA